MNSLKSANYTSAFVTYSHQTEEYCWSVTNWKELKLH